MRIPILTYHSMNIAGNGYLDNDHVALANDIRVATAAGYRIMPLHRVVAAWLERPHELRGEKIVALTCDDGGDFDYRDLPHPVAGLQRSMLNILLDFEARFPGAQPDLFLTSFVIVSPAARAALDKTCMIGRGWWNDDWWRPAHRTGRMGIGNHSWDHNHDTLADADFPAVKRGTFRSVDHEAVADRQIRLASDYLWRHAPNPSAALFAYPYGESNEYLVDEYFPAHGESLSIRAAFGDSPEPFTAASNRWRIPRYVFGRDWKGEADLLRILGA
jgi:peptidoglycan/xylan/chitin deacetylase (PgdA/CDA1 family)